MGMPQSGHHSSGTSHGWWKCCGCAFLPLSLTTDVACANCQHYRCKRCLVEVSKPQGVTSTSPSIQSPQQSSINVPEASLARKSSKASASAQSPTKDSARHSRDKPKASKASNRATLSSNQLVANLHESSKYSQRGRREKHKESLDEVQQTAQKDLVRKNHEACLDEVQRSAQKSEVLGCPEQKNDDEKDFRPNTPIAPFTGEETQYRAGPGLHEPETPQDRKPDKLSGTSDEHHATNLVTKERPDIQG